FLPKLINIILAFLIPQTCPVSTKRFLVQITLNRYIYLIETIAIKIATTKNNPPIIFRDLCSVNKLSIPPKINIHTISICIVKKLLSELSFQL
ncbi:hypothetical protein, partial [Cytobacillus sp. Bac17]|uniref:hypothetical protein n=1 Tax=Cytobacillus sp. Bac17 TaxID=2926008 RepID=UPI0021178E4D